jgi:hypothetical protein
MPCTMQAAQTAAPFRSRSGDHCGAQAIETGLPSARVVRSPRNYASSIKVYLLLYGTGPTTPRQIQSWKYSPEAYCPAHLTSSFHTTTSAQYERFAPKSGIPPERTIADQSSSFCLPIFQNDLHSSKYCSAVSSSLISISSLARLTLGPNDPS